MAQLLEQEHDTLARNLIRAADSLSTGDGSSDAELPICSFDHEAHFLRPPRVFRAENGAWVTEPTCVLSALCRGRSRQIQNAEAIGGHSLMAYVLPDEIEPLRRFGTLPNVPRPCLLCARVAVDDLLHLTEGVVPGGPSLLNGFVNTGYRADCVNSGAAADGSVIVGAVAKPCLPALVWRTNEAGEPEIDQSALRAQDFRMGAARAPGTRRPRRRVMT